MICNFCHLFDYKHKSFKDFKVTERNNEIFLPHLVITNTNLLCLHIPPASISPPYHMVGIRNKFIGCNSTETLTLKGALILVTIN